MTEHYSTRSTEETEALGREVGERFADGKHSGDGSTGGSFPGANLTGEGGFIALFGEMGVGKTAFVRGVCSALGISRVKSPTYTIVNEYRGGVCPVFHFDFYRLTDGDDLASVGYDDYLRRGGLILTEWSERMPDAIPPDALRVTISRSDGADGREITVETPDRGERSGSNADSCH